MNGFLHLIHRAQTATAVVVVVAVLAGCGAEPEKARRGCVVVDVSPLPLRELTSSYLPGFQRFVQRIATNGSGDVCFAFAAQGLSGGGSAWAKFGCTNPADELRCEPEIERNVAAAAAQLSAVAQSAGDLQGASQLVEAISLVAPALRPGDEILLLSDGIQNSGLVGDFTVRKTELDPAGIDRILGVLEERDLLPDLGGRTLRIPFALYSSGGPLNMGAARKRAIKAFWQAYAVRTGAELVFEGGAEAA